jgi:hypothetical protein
MMTSERWRQVCGILEGTLDLAQAERTAFLDRHCAADNPLRLEVDRLLALDGKVD